MHRLAHLTLATLLLATAASAAEDLPGSWISGKLVTDQKGHERNYKLYVPSSRNSGPVPLVVMLHGCGEDPDIFAESTQMNEQAEREGFLVLYPAQGLTANPTRCWNWFLPANQSRGNGEPAEIVALVNEVAKTYPVDRKQVYVAGLSAGASMSAILAACYPDVFAAAGIHAGTMYRSATNPIEASRVMVSAKTPDAQTTAAQAWQCGGQRKLQMPVLVVQGQGDNVVNKANADAIVRQFLALNDWSDDGQANGSVPQKPTIQTGRVDQGHAFSVANYTEGDRTLIAYYRVEDMGHAWSGGKNDVRFTDGKGPNASSLMWNFFAQHSR
jgi:poly(hydroxyalkanoate) depolymerase family esterase